MIRNLNHPTGAWILSLFHFFGLRNDESFSRKKFKAVIFKSKHSLKKTIGCTMFLSKYTWCMVFNGYNIFVPWMYHVGWKGHFYYPLFKLLARLFLSSLIFFKISNTSTISFKTLGETENHILGGMIADLEREKAISAEPLHSNLPLNVQHQMLLFEGRNGWLSRHEFGNIISTSISDGADTHLKEVQNGKKNSKSSRICFMQLEIQSSW